uniref:39S ribosomal protein L9, mitochondrial n=1 Tax=Panagrellus redivivus TaxID=6233 RepID=A0A7E5A2C3_PANRE
MRIAGQYCTMAFYNKYSEYFEWHQPIYEGLSMNEIISSTVALQRGRVFKAVCKGRKVHNTITLPSCHYNLAFELESVKDGVIKELIVSPIIRLQRDGFKAWEGLKIERIEFPDIDGGIFRRDVLHPHRPHAAYLKSICMTRRIVADNVIQMLKRHLFLKELNFHKVEFNPSKRLNFEETLKHIQKKTDLLWKFMVSHPGTTITVKWPLQQCLFYKDTDKLNTVQRLLSSEFILEATEYHVSCKLMKTQAMKTLEVNFIV